MSMTSLVIVLINDEMVTTFRYNYL